MTTKLQGGTCGDLVVPGQADFELLRGHLGESRFLVIRQPPGTIIDNGGTLGGLLLPGATTIAFGFPLPRGARLGFFLARCCLQPPGGRLVQFAALR